PLKEQMLYSMDRRAKLSGLRQVVPIQKTYCQMLVFSGVGSFLGADRHCRDRALPRLRPVPKCVPADATGDAEVRLSGNFKG
ncbi:hypothetical protein P3G55_20530, partial [Leptospira sp. 96542]|nr:hypothetical protein [Leptospira sp. 96542]